MTESQAAYPAAGRDSLASETGSQPKQGVRPPTRDTMNRMADRTVQEPVEESAPLARREADRLCHPDGPDRQGCAWYHGVWQYLRLLGVAAAPSRNAGFFLDTFEALAREGDFHRVLISGTADYSMLAYVLQAYRNGGATPLITIVDHCETPLYLCRWYAERLSQTIATHAGDILAFAPADDELFDAVCCHSFLSKIPPTQRNGLIATWKRALRPGGKIVTNTRLNPSWSEQAAGFTPRQITAFRDQVYREAVKQYDTLHIDPEQVAEDARLYAERSKTFSIRTQEEVVALFEDGGFTLEHFELTETGSRLSTAKSGPGTAQKATYAEIVAIRR